SSVAAECVPPHDHDHGADDGDDDSRRVDARGVVATGQRAGDEPADETTDDAEHDVPDHAEALVTLDEVPGEPAGDRADHQPRDDSHGSFPPMQFARRGHRASGLFPRSSRGRYVVAAGRSPAATGKSQATAPPSAATWTRVRNWGAVTSQTDPGSGLDWDPFPGQSFGVNGALVWIFLDELGELDLDRAIEVWEAYAV